MKKTMLLLAAAVMMLLGTITIPQAIALDGTPGPNCSPTGQMCKP